MAMPLSGGAVQATVADPLPGTAVPMVGADGASLFGVTLFEAADSALGPTAFTAMTVKV